MNNTDDDTTKEAGSGPLSGRELDFVVALKMGLKASFHYPENWPHCDCRELMFQTSDGFDVVPDYSENKTAAFTVVEFMIERKFTFHLKKEEYATWWDCDFGKTYSYWGREDTATLAICKAFLAANLEDKDREE